MIVPVYKRNFGFENVGRSEINIYKKSFTHQKIGTKSHWPENICLIVVGSNENEEEWKKTRPAAADKARWKQRTWMIWTDVITGCG